MLRITDLHPVLASVVVSLTACGEGKPAPGDPSSFDPVARYGDVAAFAGGGLKLQQLSAKGVREDGTVDLEEKRFPTSVEYHFAKSVDAPADAPPVGAGGSDEWSQRVIVLLSKAGDVGEESDRHGTRRVTSKGMRRVEPEPDPDAPKPALPKPKCSFADLWVEARNHGAPAGAVASVLYMDSRYELRVSDLGFVLAFDTDCAVIEE